MHLLVSQRRNRIHSRGSARREVSGEQRGAREQQSNAQKRGPFYDDNVVEGARESMREEIGGGHADRQPDPCNPASFAHGHLNNVGGFRAHSYSYADLSGPLTDEVGNDGVNAGEGQEEGDCRIILHDSGGP